MSAEYKQFLAVWGVNHRLSSVAFAQSNGRAELGVKASKRIIYDNTNNDGSLDNDKVAMAVLQYRNTTIADIGASPAQLLMHRQLRDSIPSHPSRYKPHRKWIEAAAKREIRISRRNAKLAETYNASAHTLPPLEITSIVAVQDRQKRWVRTGRIVERLDHRQYRVRMDGSGRITLRNRRFLRKIHPSIVQPTIIPSAMVSRRTSSSATGKEVHFSLPLQATPSPTRPTSTPRALQRLQAHNRSPVEHTPTSRLRSGEGRY